MHKPFDSSFIKLLKKGDQQAIANWYDQSAPALLGVCMRYCQSMQDAEDLLHNGLLKVLGVISSFKYQGPGGFEAWVKRILINTALNQIRAEAKNRNVRFNEAEVVDYIADEDENSFPALEPEELISWIRELPLGYRTVLNLYVFEGFTHKEIAKELNVAENTSKSQLSKARNMLRKRAAALVKELEINNNG